MSDSFEKWWETNRGESEYDTAQKAYLAGQSSAEQRVKELTEQLEEVSGSCEFYRKQRNEFLAEIEAGRLLRDDLQSKCAELERELDYQKAVNESLLTQCREYGKQCAEYTRNIAVLKTQAGEPVRIPAARINDFCEQVFKKSADMYDLRVFDFARLVEQEVHQTLRTSTPAGSGKWQHNYVYDQPCYKCKQHTCNGSCVEPSTPSAEQAIQDTLRYGVHATKDGKRIAPTDLYPAAEPVAWMSETDIGFDKAEFGNTPVVPLYAEPVQKYKPCGCVLCTCENEDQCQGCGAKYCEQHKPSTPAAEPTCNPHPDAPHGFDRTASLSQGRYVCECEGWEPNPAAERPELKERAYNTLMDSLQEKNKRIADNRTVMELALEALDSYNKTGYRNTDLLNDAITALRAALEDTK